MGEVINRAAAALKQQAGLPTDVPQVAAPSPAPSTPTLPGQVQVPPAQKSPQEIMALKDKAIADKDARIAALEAGSEQQIASIAKMIDAKLNPPEAPKPPQLPPLPSNLDDLPAREQIQIIAKHEAAQIVQSERQQERDAIMQVMAPVLTRMRQNSEVTDKLAVTERYPGFDYAAHKPAMDELEKQLPGSSPLERAVIAAQKLGNEAQLLPVAPQAPASLPAVPSMSTASGMLGAPAPQAQGPEYGQLLNAAAKLGMQRKSVEQGVLIDALLKQKVRVPAQ